MQLLSMAVRSWALTIMRLCERKGRPRMISWQRLGATMARTVRAEYQLLRSCNLSLTQWVSETCEEPSPLEKKALETGKGQGSKRVGRCRRLTSIWSIRTGGEPWSIRAETGTRDNEDGSWLSTAHSHKRWGKMKGMCVLTESLESRDKSLSPAARTELSLGG